MRIHTDATFNPPGPMRTSVDPKDLQLCLHLLQNSRTPVRELAEKLDLSVAAVHARLQSLQAEGIIKAFTARPGLIRLQATTLILWGTSAVASNDEVRESLRKDDHVYWLAFAGAGSLYVGAYLRSTTELDATVSSIVKAAGIENPTIGIIPMGGGLPDEPVLDRLDARIVRALQRDARKSIADVAEELGLSAKTVGRRLGRMEADNRVELSMEWYPDAANDIITMWHLDLVPGTTRDKVATRLVNGYHDNLLFVMPMSNLPQFLLIATWTGSMKELKDLDTRIRREKDVSRVVPNVLYTGYMFDTWRDRLLLQWAGPKETPRKAGTSLP